MDFKNIDLEIWGRDHDMSRTKDRPMKKRTRKWAARELHTNGLEEDHVKTSGARASAVAFRKFVF